MRENYVEYILGDCKGDRISHNCIAYATRDDLIVTTKAEFCGEKNILDQWNIVYALRVYLNEQREAGFSVDTKKLYERCIRRIECMYSQIWGRMNTSYDKLFELLV